MRPRLNVHGPRLALRAFQPEDAGSLTEIQRCNRAAFDSVMPPRAPEFFTEAGQVAQIAKDCLLWDEDRGYAFAVLLESRLIGRVAISNVVRGAWQSATLGYWIDGRLHGRGMATEAVQGVLAAVFGPLELHRVQAAIMPRNGASLRVIEKVGFHYEGYAPYYLNINGCWEDHKIFSLTREGYHGPSEWTWT